MYTSVSIPLLLFTIYFTTVFLTIDKIAIFGLTPKRLMTDHYLRSTRQSQNRSSRHDVSSRSRRKSKSPYHCNSMTLGRLVLRKSLWFSLRIVVVNDSGALLYYPQSLARRSFRSPFTFYRKDCLKGASRKVNIIFLRATLHFSVPFFPGGTYLEPPLADGFSRSGKDDCDEQPSGRSQTRAI